MNEIAEEAELGKTNSESVELTNEPHPSSSSSNDAGEPVETDESSQTDEASTSLKHKKIPNSKATLIHEVQVLSGKDAKGEKTEKTVNALIFSFNDSTEVFMSHYRTQNTWNTLLWKQNGQQVVAKCEKNTRNAMDKLEERTLRRLVTEMIALGVVKKPREGLKLLKNLIDNLDDEDIDWLYKDAYADYEALKKSTWFFFAEGRKNIFNSEAIANHIITNYREKHQSNVLSIEDTEDIFTYENGIYVKSTNDVEIMIRQTLGRYSSTHYVRESIASVRMKTLIDRELFNMHNGDLNLNNGIFNYHTQEFRSHNINSLFTYSLDIDYDPDVTCENILEYLEWAQPDEKARFTVLEEMAYCLVNGYPIQRIPFWYGPGGNGKGTVINILVALLGANNVSHMSLYDLEHDRNYAQANLFGKKLNACGEIPSTKTSFDFISIAIPRSSAAVGTKRVTTFNQSTY